MKGIMKTMPIHMTRVVLIILFLVYSLSAHAVGAYRTGAAQALLIDGKSGAVLFAKNPDKVLSPALFAKTHTEISIMDLLQGLTVANGNDSAITLAEGLCGHEDAFVKRMNRRAAELHMKQSHFVNTTGLPADGQRTTLRELLWLARHIQQKQARYFPLYSQLQFEWNHISQRNRNPLLTKGSGVDGFSVGFSEKEGYSIVATAEKNGRRLFFALSGFSTEKTRTAEARRMIRWGFSAFETKLLYEAGENVGEAKVYGGKTGTVTVKTAQPVDVLVRKHHLPTLTARIDYQGPLQAPVAANTVIGNITIYAGQEIVARQPVMTAANVEAAGLAKKSGDALFEISLGWLRKYL